VDDTARHDAMSGGRAGPSGLWRCGVSLAPLGAARPQENSSLGKALDPKLEGGRPRAAPSPRISGVLCAYW